MVGGLVVLIAKNAKRILDFFDGLYEFVQKYFWLVRSGLYALTKINFKSVIGGIKTTATKFGNLMKPVVSKIGKFVSGAFTTVGNAIKSFFGNLGKKALDVLNGVKNGVANAAKGAWNTVKNFGAQTWKKAGKLVPRKVRVANQKLLQTASKKVKDVAKVGKNIVKGATAATKTAVTTAKTVAKTASTVGKTALQTGKAVVGKGVAVVGKVGKWVSKLFGPKLAKEVAGAPTLFKGLSKAAKGIKIPIIGPLMVGVMSLLGGDPVGKTLFKVMGAGIGGAIGMAFANPFTMILGEMVGEFLGDLMYTIFMDPEGGMDKAGEIFKEKFKSILEGGKKVFEFMGKGFKRFWGGFMEKHSFNFFGKKIPNVVQLMNPLTTGPLLTKAFFSDEPMGEAEVKENDKKEVKEDGKKESKKGDKGKKKGGGITPYEFAQKNGLKFEDLEDGTMRYVTVYNPRIVGKDGKEQGITIGGTLKQSNVISTEQFINNHPAFTIKKLKGVLKDKRDVLGIKRGIGGVADAMTGNVFDFDKRSRKGNRDESEDKKSDIKVTEDNAIKDPKGQGGKSLGSTTQRGGAAEIASSSGGSAGSNSASAISKDDPSQDTGSGAVLISNSPPPPPAKVGGGVAGDIVVGGSTKEVIDRYRKQQVSGILYAN